MSDKIININDLREKIGYTPKRRYRGRVTKPTVRLYQHRNAFVLRIYDPAEPLSRQRLKHFGTYSTLHEAQIDKQKIEVFLEQQ